MNGEFDYKGIWTDERIADLLTTVKAATNHVGTFVSEALENPTDEADEKIRNETVKTYGYLFDLMAALNQRNNEVIAIRKLLNGESTT